MHLNKLQQQIFAILFASGEPVSTKRIAQAINCDADTTVGLINHLQDCLLAFALPIAIMKLEQSYQLSSLPEYAPAIKTCLDIKKNTPLSPAAMEVLAIVAYNQPVSRAFVEQVRGIDSSSIVISLVEKGLLEEQGRLDLPGKPIAYKTTQTFLRCFSLTSIQDLPVIELKEIIDDFGLESVE